VTARTIFERLSSIAHYGELVTVLDQAAMRAGMPVDQQLRFASVLRQLSGEQARREPLPMPPGIAP
jgi:hypothetical protein